MDRSVTVAKSYRRSAKRRVAMRHRGPVQRHAYRMTPEGRVYIDDPSQDDESPGVQFMRMLFGQPYAVGDRAAAPREVMKVAKWTQLRMHLGLARRYHHYARLLEIAGMLEKVW